MQSRSALKLIAASAIGFAIGSALPPSAKAQSFPNFDLVLDVPGPPDPNVNIQMSPAPVIQAINGTDGMFRSGSAFGRAQLGNLGAKAMIVNTRPFVSFAVASQAEVDFQDAFPLFIAGPVTASDFLSITVSLDGTTSVVGDPIQNTSSVRLEFQGQTRGGSNFAALNSPGTATIQLPVEVGVGDGVEIDALLRVNAMSAVQGSVIADFSNSVKVNAVQLFDARGNFIRDVTLVDDAGNVLPISGVPEPGSAVLLVIGMGALRVVGVRSRRRNASLVGKGSTYRHVGRESFSV
jgi:hypothetical protein